MAQKIVLQRRPAQRRFQRRDPAGQITLDVTPGVAVQPGVLPQPVILVAPPPHEGLAEIVLPTNLGDALLAGGELAAEVELELAVKGTFHHWNQVPGSRGAGGRTPCVYSAGSPPAVVSQGPLACSG